MDFHEFQSSYDSAKTIARKLRHDHQLSRMLATPSTFYKEFLKDWKRDGFEQTRIQLVGETAWYGSHQPYFKIWPDISPMLSRVHIDRIPANKLVFPYPAFAINLAKGQTDIEHVRSILVSDISLIVPNLPNRHLYIWLDLGERTCDLAPEYADLPFGELKCFTFSQIRVEPHEMIMDGFARLKEGAAPGVKITNEAVLQCWSLAVSVMFMATGMDKLVEPDVLSKDFAAYLEAKKQNNTERTDSIVKRAQRRGKLGWQVGREETLRMLARRAQGERGEPGTGHELRYQHQRSAHLRLIRDKVVFVRQATVRPDLPPRQQPGYGVR